MKQIIESQPVSRIPFVHVGYVSAPTLKFRGVNLISGMLLFVVWIFLLVRFYKKINSINVLKIGLLISFVAIFFFSFIPYQEPSKFHNNHTYFNMKRIIAFSSKSEEMLKEGVYPIGDFLSDEPVKRKDMWHNEFKISVDEDGKIINVFSSGPDRRWDTADDLSYTSLKIPRDKEDQEYEKAQESTSGRIKYFLNKNFYWGDSEQR